MDGDPPPPIKMDMGEMDSLHKSSSQHHFGHVFIPVLAYGKQVALLLRVAECKLVPARFFCDLRVRSFKDVLNLARMAPSDLVRRPISVPLLLRNIRLVDEQNTFRLPPNNHPLCLTGHWFSLRSVSLAIAMQSRDIHTAIARSSTPSLQVLGR